MTCHIRQQDEYLIASVESIGIEYAGIPGRRGLTIGARKTVVIQKTAPLTADTVPTSRFGYMPELPGENVHVATVLRGFEISFDPTFTGISLGFQSRSATDLSPIRSLAFLLHINAEHPEQTSILSLP
jgi:hypothetical protein